MEIRSREYAGQVPETQAWHRGWNRREVQPCSAEHKALWYFPRLAIHVMLDPLTDVKPLVEFDRTDETDRVLVHSCFSLNDLVLAHWNEASDRAKQSWAILLDA